jgi:hypothetical protein
VLPSPHVTDELLHLFVFLSLHAFGLAAVEVSTGLFIWPVSSILGFVQFLQAFLVADRFRLVGL